MPVKNAQATLSSTVHEILDLATDSIDRFEVLIIDDGSTDATSEVAHELTNSYPQVRLIRHGTPQGQEAAIRTGLKRSQGDVVVMRDEKGGFRVLEHRAPTKGVSPSRPVRPNYLSRIKGFVLSE
jgi:glycosyltransferase involved in cell wall biosynthesis